jgi:hypothetical protein
VKASALILLVALAVACVSQDGPFVAAGTPQMPLFEARSHCKQKSSTVSDGGSAAVDWRAYERCMADLGWVKQSLDSSAGAPAPTGGGSSY